MRSANQELSRITLGVSLAAALASCAHESPEGSARFVQIESVETTAPATVAAGSVLAATCTAYAGDGEVVALEPGEARLRVSPEGSVDVSDGRLPVAVRAGELEVSCVVPGALVVDATPARVSVLPGPPAAVAATAGSERVVAGERVEVRCEAWDAHGNRIDDALAPPLRILPEDPANEVDATGARMMRAGSYRLGCELPGAITSLAAIEVVPAEAVTLHVERVPNQPVYTSSQVVQIRPTAIDPFGNEARDAEVAFRSSPAPVESFGEGRFVFADGRHDVTASLPGATCETAGADGCAHTVVEVRSRGPEIRCVDPLDGSALAAAPGATVTVRGAVADPAHTVEARVDGRRVPLAPDGLFEAPISVRHGMNFVELSATGDTGRESATLCAFLASERWLPEGEMLSDSVGLVLRSASIDDGSSAGPLGSFGDVVRAFVSSDGLRRALDDALVAADVGFDAPLVGRVRYLNNDLLGPHSTELALVDGGLRARVTLGNVRVHLQGGLSGYVQLRSVTVGAVLDVHGVDAATLRPVVTLRPGTVSVDVDGVSTRLGTLADIVAGLVALFVDEEGIVAALIRDAVTANLATLLDRLLGSLSLEVPAVTVPRLSGSGSIPLDVATGFTRAEVARGRAVFGLGTSFRAPGSLTGLELGVALPPGDDPPLDPGGPEPVAVTVQLAALTQSLDALFRAGYFRAPLLEMPGGGSASVDFGLPPVVVPAGDRLGIELGAIDVEVTIPGVLERARLRVGGRLSSGLSVSTDALHVTDLVVEEVRFAPVCVVDGSCPDLSGATRRQLEDFLTELLQDVIDATFRDAIPSLPLPAFSIAPELATYGLPAGASLGLVGGRLTVEPRRMALRGRLGAL